VIGRPGLGRSERGVLLALGTAIISGACKNSISRNILVEGYYFAQFAQTRKYLKYFGRQCLFVINFIA